MKAYLEHDEWCIIEKGFRPSYHPISESIFSLGNGRMGHRANFEEQYSGESLQGHYVAGIYYPDKTRVGWWKNGYPEYFAKVLNAPSWIGIDIQLDGEVLDLATCEVTDFVRTLNMKEGYLERSFTARTVGGKIVKVQAKRFCSIVDDEVGAIRYAITPVNFSGTMHIGFYLDADIDNSDANYGEKFWNVLDLQHQLNSGQITAETKKTKFQVCTGMQFEIQQGGEAKPMDGKWLVKEKYLACQFDSPCRDLEEIVLYKYAAVLSSENHSTEALSSNCQQALTRALEKGYDQLLKEQKEAWARKWQMSDILIEGDIAAQQGIRFNIFQLNQTYTGEDARLNIGPKGFTGEKYGGSTYWDTEAYCLPFYLATADQHVAKNLLIYRYKHLQKAIENAAKLGFKDGAALYPMVTMNGEECHNEWEITFEEVHRNGAIAFAIYDYIRYTGDWQHLVDYGLEVLIAISRFWAQRVHFSEAKQQYVMHGVTGPNEYENNVNNNWYTSTIALWCLEFTQRSIDYVKAQAPDQYLNLKDKIKFYETTETNQWKKIQNNLFLPIDEERGIFLQQEGYLDKEQLLAADIPEAETPIWQNWSWDRILRSPFIKQADVLQGLYLLEDRFDEATIRRNYAYYEPRTVHESSLSPCVHTILAAKLGDKEKAYQLYLRTARLDLDDYNNDTEDGCHITSMAGTWMAVVKGFGGMRNSEAMLHFNPCLPEQWTAYAFKVKYRGALLEIKVGQEQTQIINHSDRVISVALHGKVFDIEPMAELVH
ncbi:MAG: family 65 glycosyl hydrolase domain-containing protein [Bacteroidota bacterium]